MSAGVAGVGVAGAHLNDHPDIVVQHRCLEPVSIYGVNRGLRKWWTGLRWFARAGGLADLRTAVRLTREILAQPALAPYRGEELNPGDGIRSDEDIDVWVRRGGETCYHPVGLAVPVKSW